VPKWLRQILAGWVDEPSQIALRKIVISPAYFDRHNLLIVDNQLDWREIAITAGGRAPCTYLIPARAIPIEGAPSFRVLCERVGGMDLNSIPLSARRVGPRFPPFGSAQGRLLQRTQGWGTPQS